MANPFNFLPLEELLIKVTLHMAENLREELSPEIRKEIMELLLIRDTYVLCLLDCRAIPEGMLQYAKEVNWDIDDTT